jgi:hypothetical protein
MPNNLKRLYLLIIFFKSLLVGVWNRLKLLLPLGFRRADGRTQCSGDDGIGADSTKRFVTIYTRKKGLLRRFPTVNCNLCCSRCVSKSGQRSKCYFESENKVFKAPVFMSFTCIESTRCCFHIGRQNLHRCLCHLIGQKVNNDELEFFVTFFRNFCHSFSMLCCLPIRNKVLILKLGLQKSD